MGYKPYWPETVLFWGAGATVSLGIRSTGKLQNDFFCLAGEKKLDLRVKEVFSNATPKVEQGIIDLFMILGESEIDSQDFNQALSRQKISKSRAVELRQMYDWITLKELILMSTSKHKKDFQLYDLYNLIDLHLHSGQGFHNLQNKFVRPENLAAARRTIMLLTVLMHSVDYQNALKNNQNEIQLYIDFFRKLAERMQKEGLRKKDHHPLNKRDFYLFSYAVISMNWDPLFLWYIFNAHKEMNDSARVPYIGSPKIPMKLFHDLGHFMGVREVKSAGLDVWYPMNETAVQRLNDPTHETGRRVRIGKLYFPHGMHGFRECPNCGKLTVYLGDEWGYDSDSLFPPLPLDSLGNRSNPRTEEERKARNERSDVLQCVFCGEMTEFHHTTLVMQSAFKGNHPSFVEEIQRDMKVSLEKAYHIILFGYSLPQDDFIYKSILTARQMREKDSQVFCSVVNFDKNAPSKWLYGEELNKFIQANPNSDFTEVIYRAKAIFGENVRGYGAGIPSVFLNQDGKVDHSQIKQLFTF